MVTSEQLNGQWTQLQGHLQERWGELTNDDLSQFNGRVKQLVGFVAQKTGAAKQEVEEYIDEFAQTGASVMNNVTDSLQDYTNRARETVGEYASTATDAVREGYDRAAKSVHEGYEQATDCIRRSPMESLAVSFGTGIITGVIVTLLLRRQ